MHRNIPSVSFSLCKITYLTMVITKIITLRLTRWANYWCLIMFAIDSSRASSFALDTIYFSFNLSPEYRPASATFHIKHLAILFASHSVWFTTSLFDVLLSVSFSLSLSSPVFSASPRRRREDLSILCASLWDYTFNIFYKALLLLPSIWTVDIVPSARQRLGHIRYRLQRVMKHAE